MNNVSIRSPRVSTPSPSPRSDQKPFHFNWSAHPHLDDEIIRLKDKDGFTHKQITHFLGGKYDLKFNPSTVENRYQALKRKLRDLPPSPAAQETPIQTYPWNEVKDMIFVWLRMEKSLTFEKIAHKLNTLYDDKCDRGTCYRHSETIMDQMDAIYSRCLGMESELEEALFPKPKTKVVSTRPSEPTFDDGYGVLVIAEEEDLEGPPRKRRRLNLYSEQLQYLVDKN